MDPRERWTDIQEAIETAMDARQARMWTVLPVMVTADSDGHTASLQSTVKAYVIQPDGTPKLVDIPPITDVPIHHPSGGGATVTVPVKKGDEGAVLIFSRAIDAWFQQGGIQPTADARMHSLSDGLYIPGVRSTPRKLSNISTESIQVRSDDGAHIVDLHPMNGITASVDNGKHSIALSPTTGITHTSVIPVKMNAPGFAMAGHDGVGGSVMEFTGTIHLINGSLIVTNGDVIADSVDLKTHVHTLVVPGDGNSGPPAT